MGMPQIQASGTTRAQAINDLITSIALEEAALSHIINAEGEKLQKFVCMDLTYSQLLEANNPVKDLLAAVCCMENALKDKLESVFEEIHRSSY